MAGNVWEWTSVWYDVYPAGDKSVSDSFGTVYKVLRDGSWDYLINFLRAANRYWYTPDYTSYVIGFRCSLSLP